MWSFRALPLLLLYAVLLLQRPAASRSQSACQFVPGKDFGGPGAQAQGVNTQQGCCDACNGNAQCKASVWVKTATFAGCYMKYTNSSPMACTNGCVACIPGGAPPQPSDGSFALKADLSGQAFFDGFEFFTATVSFAPGLRGIEGP